MQELEVQRVKANAKCHTSLPGLLSYLSSPEALNGGL